MDSERMAREAFWGTNEALYEYLCELAGYEWDGGRHAANGLSLAQCIALVEGLTADEMDALRATGIVA